MLNKKPIAAQNAATSAAKSAVKTARPTIVKSPAVKGKAPKAQPQTRNLKLASAQARTQNYKSGQTAEKNTTTSTPPSSTTEQSSRLQTLLRLEGEAMNATDFLALKHIAVNRSRALVNCGHILWVKRNGSQIKLAAITAQEQVDPNTPFAQWIQGNLQDRANKGDLDNAATWQFESQRSSDTFSYPFIHAHYAPFAPNPKAGGLLFTSDTAFAEPMLPLLARLGQVFGVSDAAMRSKKRARMSGKKRSYLLGSTLILGLIALIPIPVTSLAPAEIVAAEPFIISAPIEGVVKTILVPPNSAVQKDTALVQFEDTALRNEFILAEQEFNLADSRRRQASLRAFIDNDAKRELAIAEAEVKLAAAHADYARERLSQTVLRAPQDGLALYTDISDWTGRPVSTGEAIIKIADPTRVLLRIDAPLAHGESLQSGARVRLFLDADPINPIEAELTRASYQASPTPEGGMAYEAYADFEAPSDILRIGGRGVAKIYGEKAPIGYWLIRRPLTLARQIFGL